MLVFTAKVSKGKIFTIALILLVVIGLLVTLCNKAGTPQDPPATEVSTVATNDQRIAFLEGYGWQVTPTPVESQEVSIPEELPDILAKYNELQKSQGFDLTQFGGQTVQRFVYAIENFPDTTEQYFATILIADDQVIAGDVASNAQGGLMQGLAYPETT